MVDLKKELIMTEVEMIRQALIKNGGNIAAAARSLSLNRTTLHMKIDKFAALGLLLPPRPYKKKVD